MISKIVEIKPTPFQMKVWELLQDDTTSYIFAGGSAGSSKTWMICSYLYVMCKTYPRTRWFAGRLRLKDLRASFLFTLNKVVTHCGLDPYTEFKLNSQDNFVYFPSTGSRIDLLDLTDEPSDPYFSRYGSTEFTGGAVDECSEISHAAFQVLQSRVGRCMNQEYNLKAKILLCSNPSKNWLYYIFYKPYKEGTLEDGYAVVLSTAKDNPFLPGYTEQLMRITDASQRERLLGNWEYDAHDQGLISYDACLDLFSGVVSAKVQPGEAYISADVARFGSDSTVIMLWSGLRVMRIEMYEKLSTPEVVEKIKALKDHNHIRVSNIVIDSDGVGGGVADAWPGSKHFVNNGSAIEVDHQKQNFQNLKSQCYVKLAELINEREIFINSDNPKIKSDLIQELEQIKLKDQEGKLGVISKSDVKDAIGRSPDLSDALMMRMIFELEGGQNFMGMSIFSARPGTFDSERQAMESRGASQSEIEAKERRRAIERGGFNSFTFY